MSKHLFLWTSVDRNWRAIRVDNDRKPRFVAVTQDMIDDLRVQRAAAVQRDAPTPAPSPLSRLHALYL
jgi:hypothetical protein